jgi:hypothetical protein
MQGKQKAQGGNFKASKKWAPAKLQKKMTLFESDTDNNSKNYGKGHDEDEEESIAEREESRSAGSDADHGDAKEDNNIVGRH